MNATTQKLELIQWISNLDDICLLKEVVAFRKHNQSKTQSPKRFWLWKRHFWRNRSRF